MRDADIVTYLYLNKNYRIQSEMYNLCHAGGLFRVKFSLNLKTPESNLPLAFYRALQSGIIIIVYTNFLLLYLGHGGVRIVRPWQKINTNIITGANSRCLFLPDHLM